MSWVRERSWPSPSWQSPSGVRGAGATKWCSPVSSSKAASVSPTTSRWASLWARSWRVIFAVLIAGFGIAWQAGYILAAIANRDVKNDKLHLAELRRASEVFPCDHVLRRQASAALIVNADIVPPQLILMEIERTLQNDPFAWDLLHDRDVMRMRIAGAKFLPKDE